MAIPCVVCMYHLSCFSDQRISRCICLSGPPKSRLSFCRFTGNKGNLFVSELSRRQRSRNIYSAKTLIWGVPDLILFSAASWEVLKESYLSCQTSKYSGDRRLFRALSNAQTSYSARDCWELSYGGEGNINSEELFLYCSSLLTLGKKLKVNIVCRC